MSELSIGLIGAIAGAVAAILTAVVTAFVTIRMIKPNVQVLNSQVMKNKADAFSQMQETIGEFMDQAVKQQEQIEKLIEGREHRDHQIAELQARQQADLMETAKLQQEVTELRQQITDGDQKYNKLNDKYTRVVEFLFNYLKDRGETVPPDLALLLGDSISKFKWKDSGK